MVDFKLGRKRRTYILHGNLVYFLKERSLRRLHPNTSKDTGFLQLRSSLGTPIHSISYKPAEQQKKYAGVALHFVEDGRIRLALALQCGNMEATLEATKVLYFKFSWERFEEAALLQGNFCLYCYQYDWLLRIFFASTK